MTLGGRATGTVRDSILELLAELDDKELNLNSYYEDSGYSSLINDVVSARLRALAGYLRQLEMPDLLEVVLDLDPEGRVVETLETIRSYVRPEVTRRLDEPGFAEPSAHDIPTDELISEIEAQRGLMISVATGGPRIQSVNREYIERRGVIASGLSEHGIRDPNTFSDLWAWYGKWSSGDLPTYQSRRDFVRELYDPIVEELRVGPSIRLLEEATGWERVDRGIDQVRRQLRTAQTTEQFQAVGLYCRETLISLAQEVFNPEKHASADCLSPSSTDAKRMLEAFISAELVGSANEIARKHAKAALDLANQTQHQRTASFRDAAVCAEATTSVVNIVAVISGKRGE